MKPSTNSFDIAEMDRKVARLLTADPVLAKRVENFIEAKKAQAKKNEASLSTSTTSSPTIPSSEVLKEETDTDEFSSTSIKLEDAPSPRISETKASLSSVPVELVPVNVPVALSPINSVPLINNVTVHLLPEDSLPPS